MRIVFCRVCHKPFVRDRKFIRSYQALGHEVIFVGNGRRVMKVPERSLCEVRYAGPGYPYGSKWVPLGMLAYSAGVVRRLRRIRPSVVHARDLEGVMGTVAYKRLFDRSCKIVYDIGDAYSVRYRVPKSVEAAFQCIDDLLMTACDVVVLPGENRRANFRYRRPGDLYIVPNCPFLSDAPEPSPLPPGKSLRLIMSGNLTPMTGGRQIVRAAKIAGDVEVLILSEKFSPGLREELEKCPFVTIRPEVSQREALKITTTCNVVVAFYDPAVKLNRQACPNKLFDAMATARPVLINSEVDLAKQVVDEWKCGYSVGFHDTEQLADLLGSIRANPDRQRRLGLNGRRLFEKTYNWEAIGAGAIQEYLGKLRWNQPCDTHAGLPASVHLPKLDKQRGQTLPSRL